MSFNYGWRGPNIVKDGLIIYLDPGSPNSYFNKTSTTIKDISGNGNNGTLFNFGSQIKYNSDNGGSILLDGIDDEIVHPLTTSIQSINTTNELTISVFFKINFLNQYKDIVGINKVSGNNPFCFRVNDSNQYLFDCEVGGVRKVSFYSGTTNDIYNQWVQLSATIGGGKVYTYKNGVQDGNLNASGNIKTLDSYFGLLPLGYGRFSGNVSQILLYNKALTAQQILQNFNTTKSRFGL